MLYLHTQAAYIDGVYLLCVQGIQEKHPSVS